MDKIINLGIPHVGELIFENIDTPGLIKCLEVSQTWKVVAENVLLKRWKGKMLEACKSGETKIVQVLLERCNSEESGLNAKDEDGCTAFLLACFYGNTYVVKLLLDQSNIDLNARNNHQLTAFILACSERGNEDVIKLLLDHSERINLNATDNYGLTAFILACLKGHKNVVQLLLDHYERIEVNAADNSGLTGFMYACKYGHKNVAQLLLQHSEKIELNARNNGRTAFTIACFRGQKDVVKLLLEHSKDVDITIPENYSRIESLSREIRYLIDIHQSRALERRAPERRSDWSERGRSATCDCFPERYSERRSRKRPERNSYYSLL